MAVLAELHQMGQITYIKTSNFSFQMGQNTYIAKICNFFQQ